jgi:hypothetical protein
VSAGWFALAGVLIGGLLNGLVTWLLDHLRGTADARVAALLVSEELMAAKSQVSFLKEKPVWGALRAATFGKRQAWEENRSTLGHALLRSTGTEGYLAIAVAYNGLTAIADRAPREAPEAKLTEDQEWVLGSTLVAVTRAYAYLGLVIDLPPHWKMARRKLKRDAQAEVERLLAQDPDYQEFVARFGAEPRTERAARPGYQPPPNAR